MILAAVRNDNVPRAKYHPPPQISRGIINDLVHRREFAQKKVDQLSLLGADDISDATIYFVGDLDILLMPSVAIVGAREASQEGASRAYKLAKELAASGIVVTSGLARGIDAAAHYGAIDNGGRTMAVIGTPLDKASPLENSALQERIYRDHLLMSPFAIGERTMKASFPKRNRVMAVLTDATVIVEASDTSGSLHQASECLKKGRWLFILKSVAENPNITWPKRFIADKKTKVVSRTTDILERIIR